MDIFRNLTRGISFKKPARAAYYQTKNPSEKSFAERKTHGGKSSQSLDELFSTIGASKKLHTTRQVEEEIDDDFEMDEDIISDKEFPSAAAVNSPAESGLEFIDALENGEDEDSDDSDLDEPGRIQIYSGAEPAEDFEPKQRRKKKKHTKDAAKLAQIQQEEVNRFRNQNSIHVHGSDVCEPISAFSDLEQRYQLDSRIISNISDMGYRVPTPIQMQAIPVLLELISQRRDILASAPTGSGKTAAFVIPILHALTGPEDIGYRAVIVSPTRELAKQTFFEIERLGAGMGFRVHLLEDVPKVIRKVKAKRDLLRQFDILVTTPNRLVYLINAKPAVTDLKAVEWLIIDESDKLFESFSDGGFRDQLAIIYKACSNSKIRRALFSATFAPEVEEWCQLNLDNVVGISIGARNCATATIDQKLVFAGNETGKVTALRQIFQKDYTPPVLIFVQTKQKAKELFKELIRDMPHIDVIHSDRDQKERDAVVSNFRAGKVWTLIATEVLGRGVDFKGVNLVINYDFPLTSISYIHRIGRTGRAGQRGQAVTLFTEKDAPNLRSIASVMQRSGCEVPEFMLQLKPSAGSGLKRLKRNASMRKKAKSDVAVAVTPIVKKKRKVGSRGARGGKKVIKATKSAAGTV